MKRTNSQNKQLYRLFMMLAIDEDMKKDLVLQYTKNRTDKSSEMTNRECAELINKLSEQASESKSQNRAKKDFNTIEQQLRRKVFKLFYDIGFFATQDSTAHKLSQINAWILKKLNLEKTLNELDETELNKLIKQLHATRRIYEESIRNTAQWN